MAIGILACALPVFAQAATATHTASTHATGTHAAPHAETPGVPPEKALERIMAGNARFVAHHPTHPNQSAARLKEVAGGQHPIAVVLSCADSRVPPEMAFDQGLGDLFVVRVAGNIVDPAVLGSIEYAVEHLGARLIVVMGHQKCGAVSAAMAGGESGNHINAVVDPITPVVAEAKKTTGDAVDAAVRLNVKKVAGELEHSEPMLSKEVAEGRIRVVGAYYSLDSGAVTLLSGAAAPHSASAKH